MLYNEYIAQKLHSTITTCSNCGGTKNVIPLKGSYFCIKCIQDFEKNQNKQNKEAKP